MIANQYKAMLNVRISGTQFIMCYLKPRINTVVSCRNLYPASMIHLEISPLLLMYLLCLFVLLTGSMMTLPHSYRVMDPEFPPVCLVSTHLPEV